MPTKGERAAAQRGSMSTAGRQPPRLAARSAEPPKELAERRKPNKPKKGMGFKAAAQDIARREGVSYDQASAILAASTRKASPAAKRANPNLKKVKKKGK